MFITVELVFKSHMPKALEPGLWFITKINPGTRKEYSEIWELDKHPTESLEEFIVKHGAPVEPYLIYDEQMLAEPEEIGWWDEGDTTDEFRDITLKDINFLLENYDGFVDIEIDDDLFDNEEEISPVLYMNKVLLCVPGLYDDEDDYEDGEEDTEFYDDDDYDEGEDPFFDHMDDDSWKED